MKWEMEIASPPSYLPCSTMFRDDRRRSSNWTHEENELFEYALALFDKDSSDRWLRIASMVPGKTVVDVKKHYQVLEDDVSDIEAGLIPIPGYGASSSFTLEWVNNCGFDGLTKPLSGSEGKKLLATRPEQERKKGIPWTEEEHRLFLMGLKKYGKGDWRNISRNFVVSRTPTQVASHAQKYFIRQDSGGKDKRRSSIHDITTASLTEDGGPLSPTQSPVHSMQPSMAGRAKKREDDQRSLLLEPNQSGERPAILSQLSPSFGMKSQVMKLQQPFFLRGNEFQLDAHNKVFHMPNARHPQPSIQYS